MLLFTVFSHGISPIRSFRTFPTVSSSSVAFCLWNSPSTQPEEVRLTLAFRGYHEAGDKWAPGGTAGIVFCGQILQTSRSERRGEPYPDKR